MKISSKTTNTCNHQSFGDKILSQSNKNTISDIKSKFNDMRKNGISVGDCFYKIGADEGANLTTNDKKYSIVENNWANNLLIIDNTREDNGRFIISEDNNVKWFDNLQDEVNIKKNSREALQTNQFLADILKKFL